MVKLRRKFSRCAVFCVAAWWRFAESIDPAGGQNFFRMTDFWWLNC
jgi:hypothetical protein